MKLTLPPPKLLLLAFLLTACDDDPEPRPYAITLQDQVLGGSTHIINDTEGNAVITSTISEGDDVNIRVWKLNEKGDILWEQTYGTDFEDVVSGILQTSDGNYLIGGYTNDSQNSNDDDFYLIKLDTEGNILWEKIFGNDIDQNNTSLDRVNDIYEGPDGTLYLAIIAQNLNRNGDFGPGIIALDSQGEELWQQAYFQLGINPSSITYSNQQLFIFNRTNLIVADINGNKQQSIRLVDTKAIHNPGILTHNDQLLTASRNRLISVTKQGEIVEQLIFDRDVRITRIRRGSSGYILSGYLEVDDLNRPAIFLVDANLQLIEEKIFTASLQAEMNDAALIGERIFSVGDYKPIQGPHSTLFLEIF